MKALVKAFLKSKNVFLLLDPLFVFVLSILPWGIIFRYGVERDGKIVTLYRSQPILSGETLGYQPWLILALILLMFVFLLALFCRRNPRPFTKVVFILLSLPAALLAMLPIIVGCISPILCIIWFLCWHLAIKTFYIKNS